MVQAEFGDDEIISEINLTPLVDVSLVLVIIFMVVAPFLTNVLKPLVLPSSSRAALSENDSIRVSVFPDGGLAVGAALIPSVRLAEALRRELAAGRKPWALVRAGREVSSGRVMDVVRDLKRAGMERIAFAALPKAGAAAMLRRGP